MGEKMSKAPIFLTVGQIRFNPILQMADSVNAIQEKFRRHGYPDFSKEDLRVVQVSTTGATPQVEVVPTVRWRFGNTKKTSEFVLFADKLIFQTTAYETSETFIDEILRGIQLVHESVQLSYVEAVGLRTVDAVVPSEGASLSSYLHTQLLGFYGVLPGRLRHSILEGVSDYAGAGQLVSRVVVIQGPLGLPMDLMPMMLVINPRIAQTNGDHALLDNDCVIVERLDWDIDAIHKKLRDAKEAVSKAFYSAVSPLAIAQWR